MHTHAHVCLRARQVHAPHTSTVSHTRRRIVHLECFHRRHHTTARASRISPSHPPSPSCIVLNHPLPFFAHSVGSCIGLLLLCCVMSLTRRNRGKAWRQCQSASQTTQPRDVCQLFFCSVTEISRPEHSIPFDRNRCQLYRLVLFFAEKKMF